MTFKEFWDLIRDNGGAITGVVLILMSLLEVSKIKINPWSWLGSVINKPIIERLDKQAQDIADLSQEVTRVSEKVAQVNQKVDEDSAISARYRILRFDDELLHGIRHTKEHFDQILVDIDIYEDFCDKNPYFKNNLAVMAISHIKTVYQKCSVDNSFL